MKHRHMGESCNENAQQKGRRKVDTEPNVRLRQFMLDDQHHITEQLEDMHTTLPEEERELNNIIGKRLGTGYTAMPWEAAGVDHKDKEMDLIDQPTADASQHINNRVNNYVSIARLMTERSAVSM